MYFRPRLQLLEDRVVPSQVNWINPRGGNWGVVANWDANRVPGPADDAIISQPGITIIHSFGNDSVRSLTSQAAIIDSGGSLTLGNALSQIFDSLSVTGNGSLVLSNATLNGSGTLSNMAVIAGQGGSNVNTALTNGAGATLRVLGSGVLGSALLTLASGFTNEGVIELTTTGSPYDATLTVGNGTLTNAPGAVIQSLAGVGGSRAINAQIDNQSTIRVFQSIIIGNSGRTFTCVNGALNVDVGRTLTINGGTTVLGQGTALTGRGIVDLAGTQSLALASDVTLSQEGAALTFSGTVTVQGSALLLNQRTLGLTAVTVNVTLRNEGTLVTQGSSTINGLFMNSAGATLRVLGSGALGSAMLTLANGFTNVSLINGFTPASGATFQIVTFRSHSGTFSTVNIDPVFLPPTYDATDVTIQAI